MMSVKIIKMEASHVSDVALIEKECFSTPWTEKGLSDELTNPNAFFFVAIADDKAAGYIGSHNILGEVYITNVAVRGTYRRQGIARALVEYLCEFFQKEKAEFITLEVRESNESAKSLYEKTGFSVVGKRKNFYESPREDALLMTKFLR